MSPRSDPSDPPPGRQSDRPSDRSTPWSRGRDDEDGAPLVPDLGDRGGPANREPTADRDRPANGEATARRPRRPDPFELALMEDAE